MSRSTIRSEALSVDEAIAAVKHASAGGIALFLGVVRDHNQGKPTSLLEYDAYVSMAERELARITQEIEAELPEARVFAVHRTGELRIGELAVICAASAPHREQAFQACRALIERIKQRLPIWKREHGPDGAHWVNWEPLGDALTDPGESR
jgi:molybdopterin synthase catalytic subunit